MDIQRTTSSSNKPCTPWATWPGSLVGVTAPIIQASGLKFLGRSICRYQSLGGVPSLRKRGLKPAGYKPGVPSVVHLPLRQGAGVLPNLRHAGYMDRFRRELPQIVALAQNSLQLDMLHQRCDGGPRPVMSSRPLVQGLRISVTPGHGRQHHPPGRHQAMALAGGQGLSTVGRESAAQHVELMSQSSFEVVCIWRLGLPDGFGQRIN